jgi:glycosyltransferase involved in cell wall biosynthesis
VTAVYKPLNLHSEEQLEEAKKRFNLPCEYLLFAGRINARKNVCNLLRALRLVHDQNIPLVIAGEEDRKAPQLKEFLNDPQLGPRIVFTGPVTNDELSTVYAQAKVFCFPSFAEGMGIPPLEAMASGIPVIVSNTTSMPEVCGSAALYVDPHDPNDIAKKINQLLEDRGLYEQKVKDGFKRSKDFTWSNTAKGIMNSILAAIEDK